MTDRPARVVSLVPSTTESVVALAGAQRLVGCTRYCTHPAAELAAVARVGGTKNPSLEEVVALEPDLVLGNGEENRQEDLDWLASRVPVLVQSPVDVAQSASCLEELGAALGAAAEVAPIVARLRTTMARVQERPAPPLRVLYLIWRKPWMSVNRHTYIHDVLRLAGATNVTAAREERYPVLAAGDLREDRADVVLLPDEPWRFDAAQQQELLRSGHLGAAQVQLCSGRDFCWHGVHAVRGLERAVDLLESLRRSAPR